MFLLAAIHKYSLFRRSISKALDFLSDKTMTSTHWLTNLSYLLCNTIFQNINFTGKALFLLQQRISS